ncbi:MAG: hypothetical protein ACREL6_10030, partial [Gemmatimonadales bacterium]
GLAAAASDCFGCEDIGAGDVALVTLATAASGAVIGAFIGSFIDAERWIQAPAPWGPVVWVNPAGGGMGVGLRIGQR